LLLQDSVGGLKIQQNGEWCEVVPDEGTIIMNIGDMLHRLSNGLFKSTPHCVKNKSHSSQRFSIAYFFDMSYDVIVSPIVEGNGLKKFDDVCSGEYLMERLVKNYTRPNNK